MRASEMPSPTGQCYVCGDNIPRGFTSILTCSEACKEDYRLKRRTWLFPVRKESDVGLTETRKGRRRVKLRERIKKVKRLNKEIRSLQEKVATLSQKKREKKFHEFYDSREWRELRYQVLKDHREKHGRKCLVCGASNKVLHVDHIKPRSKHPHLALVQSNLQVLCEDCNLGKSNKDKTDWRTK